MISTMLFRPVVIFVAAGLSVSIAVASGQAIPDYPADQLTPNVYVIHGPIDMPGPENKGFMNNPAWVVTSGGIVVIDPGGSVQSGEMVLRAIRKTSDKPVVAVFNSHVHGDHWLGNHAVKAAWPDAKIYAHPRLIEQVKQGAGTEWIDIMHSLTEGATEGTELVIAQHAVTDGDVVTVGSHHFRVRDYDKAHTDTDILLEVVEESVVFLGDTVMSGRVPRLGSSSDVLGNIKACDDILKTGAKFYVPGHGKTGDRKVVDVHREYLQVLYDGVKAGYDEGLSDFEMKNPIAKSLNEYSGWLEFDSQLGKQISATYLQIEAAEF